MRDGSRMNFLIGSLMLVGCRSATQSSVEQTDPVVVVAEPEPAHAKIEPSTADTTESAATAEQIADLDALCRALDHDYVDGTLSDYYAKVEPKSAWGRERLREGEESITPGRLLQTAATSIAAKLDRPELAGCQKLFDELDELE